MISKIKKQSASYSVFLLGAAVGFIIFGVNGLIPGIAISFVIFLISAFYNILANHGQYKFGVYNTTYIYLAAYLYQERKLNINKVRTIVKLTLNSKLKKTQLAEAIKLLNNTLNQQIDIEDLCNDIEDKLQNRNKLSLLYNLFGVAYNIDGFSYIDSYIVTNLSKKLHITQVSYNYAKAKFFKTYGFKNNYDNTKSNNQNSYKNGVQQPHIENAYITLGITKQATNQEVKQAYRFMAKKHHPDKFSYMGESQKLKAEQQFKLINEAYEIIKLLRDMN